MNIANVIAKIIIKHHFNVIRVYSMLAKLHLVSDKKATIGKNERILKIFSWMYGVDMTMPQ